MTSEKANQPNPSDEPRVAGQPTKKLTFFEQLLKKAAKVLRQSR